MSPHLTNYENRPSEERAVSNDRATLMNFLSLEMIEFGNLTMNVGNILTKVMSPEEASQYYSTLQPQLFSKALSDISEYIQLLRKFKSILRDLEGITLLTPKSLDILNKYGAFINPIYSLFEQIKELNQWEAIPTFMTLFLNSTSSSIGEKEALFLKYAQLLRWIKKNNYNDLVNNIFQDQNSICITETVVNCTLGIRIRTNELASIKSIIEKFLQAPQALYAKRYELLKDIAAKSERLFTIEVLSLLVQLIESEEGIQQIHQGLSSLRDAHRLQTKHVTSFLKAVLNLKPQQEVSYQKTTQLINKMVAFLACLQKEDLLSSTVLKAFESYPNESIQLLEHFQEIGLLTSENASDFRDSLEHIDIFYKRYIYLKSVQTEEDSDKKIISQLFRGEEAWMASVKPMVKLLKERNLWGRNELTHDIETLFNPENNTLLALDLEVLLMLKRHPNITCDLEINKNVINLPSRSLNELKKFLKYLSSIPSYSLTQEDWQLIVSNIASLKFLPAVLKNLSQAQPELDINVLFKLLLNNIKEIEKIAILNAAPYLSLEARLNIMTGKSDEVISKIEAILDGFVSSQVHPSTWEEVGAIYAILFTITEETSIDSILQDLTERKRLGLNNTLILSRLKNIEQNISPEMYQSCRQFILKNPQYPGVFIEVYDGYAKTDIKKIIPIENYFTITFSNSNYIDSLLEAHRAVEEKKQMSKGYLQLIYQLPMYADQIAKLTLQKKLDSHTILFLEKCFQTNPESEYINPITNALLKLPSALWIKLPSTLWNANKSNKRIKEKDSLGIECILTSITAYPHRVTQITEHALKLFKAGSLTLENWNLYHDKLNTVPKHRFFSRRKAHSADQIPSQTLETDNNWRAQMGPTIIPRSLSPENDNIQDPSQTSEATVIHYPRRYDTAPNLSTNPNFFSLKNHNIEREGTQPLIIKRK